MLSDDLRSADSPPNEPPPPALEDRLASPLDRLAACVADFIILSPIVTLITAPFHRIAEEAQLQGRDDRWLMATLATFGAAVLLVIAYQTIFLLKWRATPGKRLFGLTVEALWYDEGVPLKAQAALLRSVAWCFEAALLGLPWIAVIGNERRRPFHDRLADTIVLSKKRSLVGPPGLSEMSLASGLVGAFFISLLIVVAFRFASVRMPMGGAGAENSVVGCDLVEHADKAWVEGLDEKKPSRMSVALALYEAEAIDDDCLKQEADVSLWKKGKKDLGYLARGLAEKADDALAQKYLDKACPEGREGTPACQALAFLNDEEPASENPVDVKLAQVKHENDILALVHSLQAQSEPFLKILAIRELTSLRMEDQALALIDSFSPQKDLAFFLSSERMKALWALNRKPESRTSLRAAVGGFDADQRVAMTRWFCQQETNETGCSETAKPPCDWLASTVEHDHVLLGDPEVTLTYIRGESCAQRLTSEKLTDLKNEMPDAMSQSFVDGLLAISNSDSKKARQIFGGLSEKGEDAGPFFAASELHLIDLAASEKDLSGVREAWLDSDSENDSWTHVGSRLMERYNEFQAWDQTIEVGFKLGEDSLLAPTAARSFVVAAYRSGQTKLALGYLQTYFGNDLANDRLPASQDGFDQIARNIIREQASLPNRLPGHLPTKATRGAK